MGNAVQRARHIEPERAIARPRKQVLDAHACQGLRLLLHQRFNRPRDLGLLADIEEAHFAQLAEAPKLLALLLARLGRAFGFIELLPATAERCYVGAARIAMRRERKERIALAAD